MGGCGGDGCVGGKECCDWRELRAGAGVYEGRGAGGRGKGRQGEGR